MRASMETSDCDQKTVQSASDLLEPTMAPGESKFNPGWEFIVAFLSLSTLTLMCALDATSLSVALPIIARQIKGTSIEAFWSGTSFLLSSTVFQPILGSFSNIFGRKPMLFVSSAFFGIGCIIAAVANNFTVVIIGRTIQGIGGGGIISITQVIVADMVPLRLRGKWLSFISAAWALGTVTGPILGGGFAQSVTWRWIFWINLPFLGIGAVLVVLFLRLNYQTSEFMTKLRRVDWVGTVVFIASTTGFLIPLTWGGVMYDWSSWRTLVPLILCAFGLVGFIVYEELLERRGGEPIIKFSVMKNRTAAVTYLGTFVHGLILWCLLYYQPSFYLEAVKDLSPILSGVGMFPMTFTVAPAAAVTGIISARTGKYLWATHSGWILTTLGMGLMLAIQVDSSTPAWIFLSIVGGFGTGILFTAMALAVQASASSKNIAYAIILYVFCRSFGQTAGVAVGGVIFQNSMKSKLLTYPLLAGNATQFSKDSSSLVQVLKQMPPSLEKTQLLESYMHALHSVYIMCTTLAAVAMFASFFTKALPLDRALETEQGFQHREKKGDEEKSVEVLAPVVPKQ